MWDLNHRSTGEDVLKHVCRSPVVWVILSLAFKVFDIGTYLRNVLFRLAD